MPLANDYPEYKKLDGDAEEFWIDIAEAATGIKEYLDENIAPCRELSLAKTAIDEAILWARKALDVKGYGSATQ